MQAVESRYQANPYHNSMHAADVLQSAMVMLETDNIRDVLTDMELLCIIISCCIHDVGHPGVNNDFLVKTGHEQAFFYDNNSVNENMHVRIAFEILQEDDCNVFEGALSLPMICTAVVVCALGCRPNSAELAMQKCMQCNAIPSCCNTLVDPPEVSLQERGQARWRFE